MTIVQKIKECIEKGIEQGNKRFIICPFGDIGMQVKRILNESYGIQEEFIIDHHLCKYNQNIKDFSSLENIDCNKYIVLLACIDTNIYREVKKCILNYLPEDNIISLEKEHKNERKQEQLTKCGKHSYGPLCNHWLVESIGAFCSIAPGVDVVENHAIEYITTHPMVYIGGVNDKVHKDWIEYKGKAAWYFDGVVPKGLIYKTNKITIGNDVWIGQNAIITNGSNIGNGVIVGANAVITKDVPDYAVVVGVPAKIIRYRYSPEQICLLNKIAWWEWSDEIIRERFDDFYLPIEDFLEKFREDYKK